jgi:hypothetical protein
MFNTKIESRNKKKLQNPFPKIMFFCFFIVVGFFKIMQGQIFLYVPVKASKMALVFGERGRECLSGPGNTDIILKSENSQDYAQKPQRNCTLMNSA